MVDIVYPLGSFSRWNNNELRYSLRSVDRYMFNIGDVIVIGDKPDFLINAMHIPFVDRYYKERNILEKLLHVCRQEFVSDNFIYMNDDHFLLEYADAWDLPFYHNGTLAQEIRRRPNDLYRSILSKTYNALGAHGLSTLHFDTHVPITINKKHFIDIMSRYDWSVAYGFAIKSIYGNNLEIAGTLMDDCKINCPYNILQLDDILKDRAMFSVGDNGLNDAMKFVLEERYPFKSYFEK